MFLIIKQNLAYFKEGFDDLLEKKPLNLPSDLKDDPSAYGYVTNADGNLLRLTFPTLSQKSLWCPGVSLVDLITTAL